MWLVHVWWWLEANNFWKAQVAFWVTMILGTIVGLCLRPWRAWKAHRRTQEQIADRLDTSTPGGLSDLVNVLHELLHEAQDEGEVPDDNGTDSRDIRKKPHGSKVVEPPGSHIELPGTHGGVIPDIHGGSSASHR